MRSHLHNLQAVRGVSCLSVVVLHLWCLEKTFGLQTPILREIRWFGFAGVDLFFVLSGFIITATNRQNMGRPAAVPGYLFRRLWRIYPTYWAMLGLSVVFLWATSGSALFSPDVRRWWPWWTALIPVDVENAFVGQAWTLSYEIMFYLAFGVLLTAPPKLAAAALCGWAVAVGVALTGPETHSPLGKLVVSPFVLEFLGGCAAAWLTTAGVRRGWRSSVVLGVGYAVVAAALVGKVTGLPHQEAMESTRLRVLVFGPPAVLLVYGLVAAEGRWPRRVPAWLLLAGDASYSLYLSHPTVLAAAKWAGVVVPHDPASHRLWVAGTLAAVLVVGLLFYRWVERPLLALGRRAGRPAVVPVAAAPEPVRKAAA